MAVSRKKTNKKTVKPGKEMVTSSIDEFKDKLINTISKDMEELTIDLKNVKDIDSTGLGILIAAKNSLEQSGGQLSLTNIPENLENLLQVLGLEGFFNLSSI